MNASARYSQASRSIAGLQNIQTLCPFHIKTHDFSQQSTKVHVCFVLLQPSFKSNILYVKIYSQGIIVAIPHIFWKKKCIPLILHEWILCKKHNKVLNSPQLSLSMLIAKGNRHNYWRVYNVLVVASLLDTHSDQFSADYDSFELVHSHDGYNAQFLLKLLHNITLNWTVVFAEWNFAHPV